MPRTKRNTIDSAGLKSWIESQELEYANDLRGGERISIKSKMASGEFTVTLGSEVLYQGNDIDKAVEEFNEA